jgi:hypothetical protein
LLAVKITNLPKKRIWEQQWISYLMVLISIICSFFVAYKGWQINEKITQDNINSSQKIAKDSSEINKQIANDNINSSREIAKNNVEFSKRIHEEDYESRRRSDVIAPAMAKSSIDQQKISWTVSLLPYLSSSDPKLQLYASLVLRDLKGKGVFPDHLMPAIGKVAFDINTDPDAALILKELLGKRKGT